MEDFPEWLLLGTAAALGACLGSFLNVVVYRLPRDLSLSHPPSTCPGCGQRIAPYDNVPVLGWLWLRGRARCCKTKISVRYPLVELGGAFLAVLVAESRVLVPGTEIGEGVLAFWLYLSLALGLVALALIDLEFMILPDSLTLGGAALGFASSFVRSDVTPVASAVGAVAGFVAIWLPFIWGYERLRGQPGMGLGDAKLLALAGAWFGWIGVLFALFAGALQGTLAAIVTIAIKGKVDEPEAVTREREELLAAIEAAEGEERAELERILAEDPVGTPPADGLLQARMPFGPFLALALLELTLFFGPITAFIDAWLDFE